MSDPALDSPVSRTVANRLLRRASGIPTPAIFLVSIVVAVFLIWREGAGGDVWDALRGADGGRIAIAAALYLFGLAMLCWRWHLLVVMIRGDSHLPRASEAFLTSVVINYAAPVGLAVPSRAALTKRALGLNAAETGAVALWEIVTDVAVLGCLSVSWLALGGWDRDLVPSLSARTALVAIAFVALLLVATVVSLAAGLRGRPERQLVLRRILREVVVFPARRPRAAAVTVAVSAAYWGLQVIVMLVLLRALGQEVGVLTGLGLIALPVLIGMLSPVPGGAGIREALMLGVARVAGAASGPVLLAALIYRFALFASIPILWAIVRGWLALGASALPAPRGAIADRGDSLPGANPGQSGSDLP